MGRQPPAFAGARDHFMGDGAFGFGHQIMRLQAVLRQEPGDRLFPHVALIYGVHFHDKTVEILLLAASRANTNRFINGLPASMLMNRLVPG